MCLGLGQLGTPPVGELRRTTMKPNHAIVCVLLIPWGGIALSQEAASTNRLAASESATEVGAPAAVSVPVPVVRVPVGVGGVEAGVGESGEAAPSTVSRSPVPGGASELGWSANGVGLREPTVSNVRTNRSYELRGVLPKVTRPERRGFGGFLSGFANLFNPLAPTAKGVESQGQHWYDGGVRSTPLPRGLRDERSHEPQSVIFGTEFGRGSGEPAAATVSEKGTAPAKR